VLDLGCGICIPTKDLVCKALVGVDAWKNCLFQIKDFAIPICVNIRQLEEVFVEGSFDVALMLDTIEHLEKREGEEALEIAEKIAKKYVIVFTPKNWDTNEANTHNPACWAFSNPYNYHKSLWTEYDFTKRGYDIVHNDTYPEYIFAVKSLWKKKKSQ